MKKNSAYAFFIDCSLDKKGNIIIYELGCRNSTNSSENSNIKKEFPNFPSELDLNSVQNQESDLGESKISQRLYLPSEVSPEFTLLNLSSDRDKEIDRVARYFENKNIHNLVLKYPNASWGKGNVFIDNMDKKQIKKGIEQIIKKKEENDARGLTL